ncbi:unnamed protein product [Durusdinium trenchii]|uniref:Uncharacterized protein n=1 Tax=Durusdinium trenchii TaxID=1381693 RepID=A0ABP0MC92_9DINO
MAAQTQDAKLVHLNGVDFLVDGFLFKRPEVKHYVLTHFHSDHTVGLTRGFDSGTIYCTEVTAALIINMMGVDPAHVRALPLEQTVEVQGVSLTFVDAGHCPGSAMAAFEAPGVDGVILHTGDCRASNDTRTQLQRWLAGRSVEELFLDTTYCSARWRFVPQAVACEWLQEITRRELEREPKTLFVVGCYQIGKERAAASVAAAAKSPVFVEPRRWKVIQLAGWGDAELCEGQRLWSIDKEGCCVWMCALGGLAHDVLKHFLDSTKGQFEAVVAFSPTGWSWSKGMAQGSTGCRCWAENDGRTRVYSVPYSEHSSFDELQALVRQLRPKRLIPTVNSETRESKERMMAPFLDVLDLKGDPERMDHYLSGGSSSSSSKPEVDASFVDVLSLSASCERSQLKSEASNDVSQLSWQGKLAARRGLDVRQIALDLDSEDSTTTGGTSSPSGSRVFDGPKVVDLDLEASEDANEAGQSIEANEGEVLDDLRHVDVDQQKRLLRYFESSQRSSQTPALTKPQLKKPSKSKAKGKGKGKGKLKEAQAPVLKHLGVKPKEEPKKAPKKRGPKRANEPAAKKPKADGPKDPKQPGEKRPARFIPKPSARVQERIDRAFAHRLYFLARQTDGDGEKLDVLGSTGNVYHVELRPSGNACSCLDFAKGGGVCKHLLFVMLRVLKLPREDHRVYQTGLTPSELQPLLTLFRTGSFQVGGEVQADATVMRGYQQAQGGREGCARQPLPADCPICFEEIVEGKGVDFCRVCGHNVHCDCQQRWASAGKSDTCPLCRSPWSQAPQSEGVVNLAAYSSEHQEVNLASLYPETHRWIQRRDA